MTSTLILLNVKLHKDRSMSDMESTMHGKSARRKFEKHQKVLRKVKLDPATLYLESLAPSGRRSIDSLLNSAVSRLGFKEPLTEVPWYMFECQHLIRVRTAMLEEGYRLTP